MNLQRAYGITVIALGVSVVIGGFTNSNQARQIKDLQAQVAEQGTKIVELEAKTESQRRIFRSQTDVSMKPLGMILRLQYGDEHVQKVLEEAKQQIMKEQQKP